jgi:hypothetical protein
MSQAAKICETEKKSDICIMTEFPKLNLLIAALQDKKYKVFTRPYELNIVGIRAENGRQNEFDDLICLFFKNDKGEWQYYQFPGTTDPGTTFLKNPINNLGTAAIVPGQYIDAYSRGTHKGRSSSYTALIQTGKIKVYRDLDRNQTFDFGTAKIYDSQGDGINIHRATADPKTNAQAVNDYSAGCQVIQNAANFDILMTAVDKHKDLYGNKFTYTLLDERQDIQAKRAYLVALLALGLVLLLAL